MDSWLGALLAAHQTSLEQGTWLSQAHETKQQCCHTLAHSLEPACRQHVTLSMCLSSARAVMAFCTPKWASFRLSRNVRLPGRSRHMMSAVEAARLMGLLKQLQPAKTCKTAVDVRTLQT